VRVCVGVNSTKKNHVAPAMNRAADELREYHDEDHAAFH
jgi:hypothetical protein